jgi:hypothetical protein
MARQKTTVYLESDLLRATKTLAASSGRREYEVIEDALRAYMRSAAGVEARRQVGEMLDRWAAADDGLDEDEAMRIAVEEVHAHRREKRFGK